jgi:predicted HicB family RNase H-like nuclease
LREKQPDKTVQKMKWVTVMTTDDFSTARAKADQVKGKVKARPSGKFDVRVGTEVHVKADQQVAS